MPDNNTLLQSNYLTYDYILYQLELIQEKILTIQSFISGPMEEVDITKLSLDKFPIMYVEPTNVQVNNFIQSYTFNIAILDKIEMNKGINGQPLENSNKPFADAQKMRTQIYSQANEIMKDIIVQFKQNLITKSWVNSNVDLALPIDLTPISSEYDTSLYGWTGTFVITANNKNDICNTPALSNT